MHIEPRAESKKKPVSSPLEIQDWGLIEYMEADQRQQEVVERVSAKNVLRNVNDTSESSAQRDVLIFCSHPPVVTLGRAATPEDIVGWKGAILETARGGRATYHGPNQLVIYPIINLVHARAELPAKDVHGYLRALENATVSALQELGLENAESRTTEQGGISLTGVWVGDKKIASIGIAIRKWVTYHGIAINVDHDPKAFYGIRPCGFEPSVMTSIEQALGKKVSHRDVTQAMTLALQTVLV